MLTDLVMLIDSYRSMIVRFASPATRGFLSPLLSLSSRLFAVKENLWDQGNEVLEMNGEREANGPKRNEKISTKNMI